jgi:hypothetical protein
MAFDRFLIAPMNSGLTKNAPPWLIPDEAFDYLQNAYIFRGRLKKRFGSTLMGFTQFDSRLRTSLAAGGAGIGITDGAGNASGNVRTILSDATLPLSIGQAFSIDGEMYTIISSAAGAQAMLATMGSGTFNIGTGAFTITGGPATTTIFFYPGLPVMGIDQYEINVVNNHPTYAFDTRYAYLFSGISWDRSGTAVWHGTNLNYFWVTNWQGIPGTTYLFVTNFNATVPTPGANDDPIWYFDGTTWTAASGANAFYFQPNGGAVRTGPFVVTARIIVAFKNRLVLLSTIENNGGGGGGTNTAYTSRARYCFYGSPFAVNAWYEKNQADNVPNVGAGGGFVDAATEEQIISAEFIKDRLIVYFERSTWELVYTQNQVGPFVWQKINTELGSQSTFSTVPFDKDVLTIGQTGVHACNGANVVRIDDNIPTTVFEFELNNDATQRTAGIRDYYSELVYWTYVDDLDQSTQIYPNQVLIYNYKNRSWAINDDCITTFGYYEQSVDQTWDSSDSLTWEDANFTWNSNVIEGQHRQIVFGTPEGFVLILDEEIARNAPSMQITNIVFNGNQSLTLTIMSHNLTDMPIEFDYDMDFILIEDVEGDAATELALNENIFQVFEVIDANTIRILVPGLLSGSYNGGGTAARVSNIQIKSKQWNPYVNDGQNFYLARIDFGVVKTTTGEITVDYYPSSSEVSMIDGGVQTGAIMGTSVLETFPYDATLYPLEQFQEILWHPIYFQASGTYIQLGISFSFEQMIDPNIALQYFEIQGMVLHTQSTSVRLE